ncbi:hypothetical protein L218DRAFT_926621 [Marasmius fiardii PR-910]|nr:hypothetical protein L218DRAFT_926621 [Marasmius fiardii PR-910]
MYQRQAPVLRRQSHPPTLPIQATPSNSLSSSPTFCGLPLKYLSLVTLAVQNAALSIVMHHSRVSTPPSLAYSPAAAVLLNELLKGLISFTIALSRAPEVAELPWRRMSFSEILLSLPYPWTSSFWSVCGEIFSPDCWKLSIPAILYVVQNSLQFVAISNLPVASFQVTYQMKILTTAAFSVLLLRKKLTPTKWVSLFFLAIGVGIVQIQTSHGTESPKNTPVGSAHDSAPLHIHVMSPLTGFAAVTAACFTSGLAGVYFEMVLKNSKADLWVRNVQLSLFSIIPALLPILFSHSPSSSTNFLSQLLKNFGPWAWATVAIQVFGGLVTAIVIKYSDNILKGFATSLSIILSFLASVVLFNFHITPSFTIGASTVLCATWMYNQPAGKEPISIVLSSAKPSNMAFTPVDPSEPIIGEIPKKQTSPFGSPRVMASALGLGHSTESNEARPSSNTLFPEMNDTQRYNFAPYGSPYSSRPPSRSPTPKPPASTHLSSSSSSDGGNVS